jgi:hypothetical protein
MAFDIKDFLSGFKAPEVYTGTENAYGAIARHGENKLAIHMEPAVMPRVLVKGNPMAVIGFMLRIVEVGEDSLFQSVFGMRGKDIFQTNTKHKVKGFRLAKQFIALTNYPCSGTVYHKFAEQAFPKLIDWFKENIEKAEGTMVLSDDELLAIMGNSLEQINDEEMDLFHLPGQKPDWLGPKKMNGTLHKKPKDDSDLDPDAESGEDD